MLPSAGFDQVLERCPSVCFKPSGWVRGARPVAQAMSAEDLLSDLDGWVAGEGEPDVDMGRSDP
jgi:hypothetical protein